MFDSVFFEIWFLMIMFRPRAQFQEGTCFLFFCFLGKSQTISAHWHHGSGLTFTSHLVQKRTKSSEGPIMRDFSNIINIWLYCNIFFASVTNWCEFLFLYVTSFTRLCSQCGRTNYSHMLVYFMISPGWSTENQLSFTYNPFHCFVFTRPRPLI